MRQFDIMYQRMQYNLSYREGHFCDLLVILEDYLVTCKVLFFVVELGDYGDLCPKLNLKIK